MNLTCTILSVFLMIVFHSTAQVELLVLDKTDSAGIVNVICINTQSNEVSFTDKEGLV